MNLLERLKAIDLNKINDEEIKSELQIAIEKYDEETPTSITNAELLLEMIKDEFPEAIKGNEEKMEDGKDLKEAEAKKAIRKGKEIIAETSDGSTYSVKSEKELKEAVKKDHELKEKKTSENLKTKNKPSVKWKNVKEFLGKDEKISTFKKNELTREEEEAKLLLEDRDMPSYNPLEHKIIQRQDGSVFERNYLNDKDTFDRFKSGMPVYGESSAGKIYTIRNHAELLQSFYDGFNHFTPTEDLIKEISEKPDESKEVLKEVKKKITKDNTNDCNKILTDIRAILDKYKADKSVSKPAKPATPSKKKALSVLVKDSVVTIMKKVINKERNSRKKIDVKKFEAAVKKGKEFLVALRKASNGISDGNDQMIKSFEKQMTEIISELQQKQTA